MKRILSFGFCALMMASLAFAQRDFSKTKIEVMPVNGSVYMLKGEGGNIGVSVGEDGVLMVDDQFAPLADKILKAVEGLSQGNIRFVLNTHWHGDHTGGNEAMAGLDATVLAHENVRKRLAEGLKDYFFDRVIEPRPKEALPVITFDTSVTIHFNGERIDVIHVPAGHTDGDSIVFFRGSNVVHMGDQFFNGFYPYIDLSSGGNVDGYIKNIERLLGEIPDGAKIIPGHGPLGDKDDLRALLTMLKEAAAIIQERVEKGLSLDEVLEVGLPDAITQKWGGGFMSTDKWITILYRFYSEHRA